MAVHVKDRLGLVILADEEEGEEDILSSVVFSVAFLLE